MKTDLQKVLSISGEQGLFTYISQARTGMIAESLLTKKGVCSDILPKSHPFLI